jgi:hypothetical protein
MRDRLVLLVLAMLLVTCRGQELPTSPKLAQSQTLPSVAGVPPLISAPSIESVTPSIGRPEGGELVRISGRRFTPPVRVLFDVGAAHPIEGFVASVSEQQNSMDVFTPAVLLQGKQRLQATVRVIVNAGGTHEMKVDAERAFTFQKSELSPSILTVSPNQAPVTGGQRMTIFGEGFQMPVAVYIEQQGERRECRVLQVDYSQIIVEVPPARHTGWADVVVLNIISGLQARLSNALRYVPGIEIKSISPAQGPATGGTLVRITGSGFIAPVLVTIGGVPATVFQISGTEVVARTNAAGCNDDGAVTVTSIVNGDTATGPVFEYRCPRRRAA